MNWMIVATWVQNTLSGIWWAEPEGFTGGEVDIVTGSGISLKVIELSITLSKDDSGDSLQVDGEGNGLNINSLEALV